MKFKQKGTLFDLYLEELTLWHGERCGGARVGANRLRRKLRSSKGRRGLLTGVMVEVGEGVGLEVRWAGRGRDGSGMTSWCWA